MMSSNLLVVIYAVIILSCVREARSTATPISQRSHLKITLADVMKVVLKINHKIDAMSKKIDALEKVINPTTMKGKNCADIYTKGFKTDGVYTIDPDGLGSFKVRCDMTTNGGGWTIFQRREDGKIDFYRDWNDYKNGFGDPKGEFWLGLDKINRLTKNTRNVLRVDLEDTTGITKYAKYSMFTVSSEKAKYQLGLGTYSGNAGDGLSPQRGMAFTTKDSDNDIDSQNCAVTYKGAWWYKSCHTSNLNGVYHHGSHKSYADGVNWKPWKGYYYSLKKTEMKIRPSGFPLNK